MDLKNLTISYARQETLNPLKGLFRYVAFGILGSLTLGIGLILWVVAILRVLQEETGTIFAGNFSWAPYLLTLLICAAIIGAAVYAISADKRKTAKRRKQEAAANANPAPGHAQ